MKKFAAFSLKPMCSTGMTGKSSTLTACEIPKQCQITGSLPATGRSCRMSTHCHHISVVWSGVQLPAYAWQQVLVQDFLEKAKDHQGHVKTLASACTVWKMLILLTEKTRNKVGWKAFGDGMGAGGRGEYLLGPFRKPRSTSRANRVVTCWVPLLIAVGRHPQVLRCELGSLADGALGVGKDQGVGRGHKLVCHWLACSVVSFSQQMQARPLRKLVCRMLECFMTMRHTQLQPNLAPMRHMQMRRALSLCSTDIIMTTKAAGRYM